MKAKWFLAVLLVVTLGSLAACGGGTTAPTTAPRATAQPEATAAPTIGVVATQSTEPVEVIWYVRTQEAEQQWEQEVVIPDFEAQYPNITINLVIVTWDDFDTRMQTMIAAGTPPDVWSHWGPSGFADYVIRGLAADLTPFIEADNMDLSDFIPEVLSIYTVDGKVYGLPMLTTASFIFYNKDLFDAAGVEYPPTDFNDTSWTYDAFVEKCAALTNNTGDAETMSFGCNLGMWPNDAYAWLWGQDLYPDSAYQTGFADQSFLDSEGAIAGFQARQDLVWNLNYMPDPAQVDAMGGGDIFVNGKVAMHLTGGWGWWQFPGLEEEFNWGVAALPYGAAGRRAVIFTDPWMMSASTPHPQEAWTLLKYLVSPEVQQGWMELTKAPPARISLAESWYSQFTTMTPAEVEELHITGLQNGRESPNHLLVRFDQLNQVVSSALDPIFNNEAQAADVLPDANAQLEATLQQIQAEYGQ
jgi:multiple sugar transport system substrate-binding protein